MYEQTYKVLKSMGRLKDFKYAIFQQNVSHSANEEIIKMSEPLNLEREYYYYHSLRRIDLVKWLGEMMSPNGSSDYAWLALVGGENGVYQLSYDGFAIPIGRNAGRLVYSYLCTAWYETIGAE